MVPKTGPAAFENEEMVEATGVKVVNDVGVEIIVDVGVIAGILIVV